MRGVVDVEGREDDDAPERGSGAGSLSICLAVLAALNLAVLMIVAQLPITAPGLERVAQQGGGIGEVYLVQGTGRSNYAFHSCAGGDSVNCHRRGNIVGL